MKFQKSYMQSTYSPGPAVFSFGQGDDPRRHEDRRRDDRHAPRHDRRRPDEPRRREPSPEACWPVHPGYLLYGDEKLPTFFLGDYKKPL